MKTIHTAASFLIVLLGLVHIGFTFRDYDGLSMDIGMRKYSNSLINSGGWRR